MILQFPKTPGYVRKQELCRQIERHSMLKSCELGLSNRERVNYVREATHYVKLMNSLWLYFRTEAGLTQILEGVHLKEPRYHHNVGI